MVNPHPPPPPLRMCIYIGSEAESSIIKISTIIMFSHQCHHSLIIAIATCGIQSHKQAYNNYNQEGQAMHLDDNNIRKMYTGFTFFILP